MCDLDKDGFVTEDELTTSQRLRFDKKCFLTVSRKFSTNGEISNFLAVSLQTLVTKQKKLRKSCLPKSSVFVLLMKIPTRIVDTVIGQLYVDLVVVYFDLLLD